MNRKNIKAVIRKKINAWLSSIDDDEVRNLAAKNTIVTGGCIVSMLLKEEVNDYDLYFSNRGTAIAVAKYYVTKFKESHPYQTITLDDTNEDRIRIKVESKGVAGDLENGAEPEQDKPLYRPVFLSSNAITLSDKIQLIIRFYGDAEEIHKNYDFVHCTSYWTSKDDELVLYAPALESILARELRYVGSMYPLCSIIRTRKFIARGWTINAGQYLKMAMQVHALDLLDIAVLEDQLCGVDTAYFDILICALRKQEGSKIDASYIAEIVDRIF